MKTLTLIVCAMLFMACSEDRPHYEVVKFSNDLGEVHWQVHYITYRGGYGAFDDNIALYQPVEVFEKGNFDISTRAQADSICAFCQHKLDEKNAREFHEQR